MADGTEDPSDERVAVALFLFDGPTQLASLSTGELGSGHNGTVVVPLDDPVRSFRPEAGAKFGDGGSGGAPLQTDHTYTLRVRTVDFTTDLSAVFIGDFPCSTAPPSTCQGPITIDEVLGTEPTGYTHASQLARFPNDDAACDAVWVPTLDVGFTPQGLALTGDGTTALVSGYIFGTDPLLCRIVSVDLDTGALLDKSDFEGCNHFGGLQFDDQGSLWVADTDALKRIDPSLLFTSPADAVQQTVKVSGFNASFLAGGTNDDLWVGSFQKEPSKLYEFSISMLLRTTGKKKVHVSDAISVIDTAPRPQGAAFHDPGVWISSSTSKCGVLNVGVATTYGFAPGVEDLEFLADGTFWAVSEAGALEFGSGPFFPVIARFDPAALSISSPLRPKCRKALT